MRWTAFLTCGLGAAEALGSPPCAAAQTVVPDVQIRALATDGKRIYVATPESIDVLGPQGELKAFLREPGTSSLAVRDGWLYWTATGDGQVRKARTNGNGVENLAIGQSDPDFIAVGEGAVFWINRGDSAVMRLAPGGGAERIAEAQLVPRGLMVRGKSVYWTTQGGITRWDGPAGPEALLDDTLGAGRFAWGARTLFWLEEHHLPRSIPSPSIVHVVPEDVPRPYRVSSDSGESGLWAAGEVLFFADRLGQILRFAADETEVCAEAEAHPGPLLATGAELYWGSDLGLRRAALKAR